MHANWMTTTFVLIDTTTKRAINVYMSQQKAPFYQSTVLFYAITAIIEMYPCRENTGAATPYVDKTPAQTPVLHGFATRLNH